MTIHIEKSDRLVEDKDSGVFLTHVITIWQINHLHDHIMTNPANWDGDMYCFQDEVMNWLEGRAWEVDYIGDFWNGNGRINLYLLEKDAVLFKMFFG